MPGTGCEKRGIAIQIRIHAASDFRCTELRSRADRIQRDSKTILLRKKVIPFEIKCIVTFIRKRTGNGRVLCTLFAGANFTEDFSRAGAESHRKLLRRRQQNCQQDQRSILEKSSQSKRKLRFKDPIVKDFDSGG